MATGGNEDGAWEKLITVTGPREGSPCTTQDHSIKHQCGTGSRKEQGESLGQSLYWGFYGKGKSGQSAQFRIGLSE